MSSSEGYEIAPDVGLVISMAENKMCWKDALCEYVDNAFDADATNVLIEIGANAKHLLIRDNGHGADDIPGFLITGKHTNKRAKLGRYGVGLKEASLYLGGENSKLCIYTTKNGKTRGVRLDWHKLVKSGRWFIPPEWVDGEHPAAPGAVGTEIVVAPVARRPLEGKEWDRLLEELGYTYTPAILKGW